MSDYNISWIPGGYVVRRTGTVCIGQGRTNDDGTAFFAPCDDKYRAELIVTTSLSKRVSTIQIKCEEADVIQHLVIEPLMPGAYWSYAFYDDDDELVYVGNKLPEVRLGNFITVTLNKEL